MHLYTHIHTNTHTHTLIRVYNICTHEFAGVHTKQARIGTRTFIPWYVCLHVHMHTDARVHIYMHVYEITLAYVYIYTDTHARTYNRLLVVGARVYFVSVYIHI